MKRYRSVFMVLWVLGWAFWLGGMAVQSAAAQTPKPGQDESCF